MQKINKFLSRKILMILFFIFISSVDIAQTIQQFSIYDDVKITIDVPKNYSATRKSIILNGHSGGGRFIFSYLDGVDKIPGFIKRISFLDSDYGYESIYFDKPNTWLQNKTAILNVFAYNDSVALLNGKRFVSDTGGTWYRSFLMLRDLSAHFHFTKTRDDSLIVYKSADKGIQFYFKTNPDKKIFHTVQVELNGFIHSVLIGTKRESKKYTYSVSYTHLRAHETRHDLVCRLLL